MKEAFGISDYFVEGSSFDCDRQEKEDMAKKAALQHELDAQKEADRDKNKRYGLVRTPSKERNTDEIKEKKSKKKKRNR